MTVERGILFVVGCLILASLALAATHSLNWLWLTALLGAHLIQASFTGFCPVVKALKKIGLPMRPGFG